MAPQQGPYANYAGQDPPGTTQPALRSNEVGADFPSSSNDVIDYDMVEEMYMALNNPPRAKFTPAGALRHTHDIGEDRDEVITTVMQRLIWSFDGIDSISKLFRVLQDGEGCGNMRIRSPREVPVAIIRAAMESKNPEWLDMFYSCGLPLDHTWEMVDIEGEQPGLATVDVWYWAVVSGSKYLSRKLREGDVAPISTANSVDHMSCTIRCIRAALDDPWFRYSWKVFENMIDVVRDLIAVTADKTASMDATRSLYFTPLLATLAGDPGKTEEALNGARNILEDHVQRFADPVRRATIRLGLDDFDRTSYMDTPLMQAVGIQWREMVQLLLDHGADPRASGRWDTTPYERARSLESEELLELLVSHDQHHLLTLTQGLRKFGFEDDTTGTP